MLPSRCLLFLSVAVRAALAGCSGRAARLLPLLVLPLALRVACFIATFVSAVAFVARLVYVAHCANLFVLLCCRRAACFRSVAVRAAPAGCSSRAVRLLRLLVLPPALLACAPLPLASLASVACAIYALRVARVVCLMLSCAGSTVLETQVLIQLPPARALL